MSLFKKSLPPPVGYRLIELCAQCGRAEGQFTISWPDQPRDWVHALCGRCVWSKLHEFPKGPARRALVRKVFGRRHRDSAG